MGKLRLREDYILDGHLLADAGSHTEPINIVDPIMDLYLKFAAKNGTTNNIRNYIFDVLNEIEVIDGSDVLFSLQAKEILALDLYHYKESLHLGINELAGHALPEVMDQECVFKIPFGIGRYDSTLAFDPTKFRNPQIRFSWNLSNVRTKSTVHGFIPDRLHVDIIATIAERYPARPAGFLMHKHIHEWETAASGDHRVEMPVDYPHRTVFLRVEEDAECPWTVLTDAKYNVDQNKYIPFDWHTDDWSLWLKEFYGMWHQGMDFDLSGGTGCYRHLFLPDNLALAVLGKEQDKAPWWSQGTGCKVYISGGSAVTTLKCHAKVDGTLPFNTWAYPFGDPEDMEEWLQVRDIGKIYFEITQGDPLHMAKVFLTQYRPY